MSIFYLFFYFRMTSSFPTASSAPPTTTTSRMVLNNQLSRISATNSTQQTSSRFKPTYDNRRYSNVQTPYKRPSQPPVTSNSKGAPVLSRVDVPPLPSARLILQQQISSPGRLQQQQLPSSPPQFVVPAGAILDPLIVGRGRPTPLPPPAVRNAIHRNAVSLNALPTNQQNGTLTRGRSQNSSHKPALSTRTPRVRQQSLAPFDLQQQAVPYTSATVIYRHPLNTEPPRVFFE
jgi:hypothetical protein